MNLQSLHPKGFSVKEHSLPDILERLVASLTISKSSTFSNKIALKDIKVPEIELKNTGELIEGYKKKFECMQQNLTGEYIEVCNFSLNLINK